MRCGSFLHDLLWQQGAAGFKQRIDAFLTIAAKHHIRPVFVLFDSCWDPFPKLGPQHPPTPGVQIRVGCKVREPSRCRTRRNIHGLKNMCRAWSEPSPTIHASSRGTCGMSPITTTRELTG